MKIVLFLIFSFFAVLNYFAHPGLSCPDRDIIESIKEGDIKGVQRSIREGAYINAVDPVTGIPGLMWAVIMDNIDIAELLIMSGADIDAIRNIDGLTPLFIASSHGNSEMVVLLIEAGADINTIVETFFGSHTPLSISIKRNNMQTAEILRSAGAK